MNFKRLGVTSTIIGIACSVILTSGCKEKAPEVDTSVLSSVSVITKIIVEEVIHRPVPCRGVVHPLRQEKLHFLASGQVLAIFVSEGERVTAGDTIAILDVAALTREWVQSGLALIESRRNLADMAELTETRSNENREFSQLERRTDLLRKIYFNSKSALVNAELIAPFNGRVIDWYVSVDGSVTTGQAAALLVEVDPIAAARVHLSEDDYHSIQVGDSAYVTPLDKFSLPLRGVVNSKGLSEELTGLPFTADLHFENPGGATKVGTAVSARIRLRIFEKVLLIPKEALVDQHDGSASVFLTDDEGKFAVRRHVDLGPEIESKVIINKGLRSGERLIIHGQSRLQHGSKIILMSQ